MTTAVIDSSARAASAARTSARCLEASSTAAGRLTSTTYLSFTPGWRATFAAWMLPMRPAPNNATSIIVFSPSSAKHPLVHRIVLEVPFAFGSRHHIQIIRVVTIGDDHGMIAPRNEHDVVVFDRERLVQRSIVGIDPLERESLRWGEAMVVRLLERAFHRKIVG